MLNRAGFSEKLPCHRWFQGLSAPKVLKLRGKKYNLIIYFFPILCYYGIESYVPKELSVLEGHGFS